MSLAEAPSEMGIAVRIREAFANSDRLRMAEIDRAIRAGHGDDAPKGTPESGQTWHPRRRCPECHSPTLHKFACTLRPGGARPSKYGAPVRRLMPVPDAPANQEPPVSGEEDEMPKGVRSEPHPCCGSKGSRHLSSCTGKAEEEPAAERKAPAPRQAARRVGRRTDELGDLSISELGQRWAEAKDLITSIDEELERREAEIREIRGSGL